MASGVKPISANTAKYADAPPCPTDENNNAAKNTSGKMMVNSDKAVKALCAKQWRK